jgi:hypothetical protein
MDSISALDEAGILARMVSSKNLRQVVHTNVQCVCDGVQQNTAGSFTQLLISNFVVLHVITSHLNICPSWLPSQQSAPHAPHASLLKRLFRTAELGCFQQRAAHVNRRAQLTPKAPGALELLQDRATPNMKVVVDSLPHHHPNLQLHNA